MSADSATQQPCTHCRDCVRACPDALDPEALFFALVGDDPNGARDLKLDACSECNRCVEVCPSHITLLDWFRWGKSELRERAVADAARARYLARDARLQRQRVERTARRTGKPEPVAAPVQTISKAEVMAAIARGRKKRDGNHHET